jgi:hypothetical protein
MVARASDPFEHFAKECGLHVTAEPMCVAPRDLLAPPAEADEYFLIAISRTQAQATPVHLLFVITPSDAAIPSIRDALWWLAADSWAVERANRDLTNWASAYGFIANDGATRRMFDRHLRQASTLLELLGVTNYQRLLDMYQREISSPRRR